mgnify:CR=1 FL=1
MMKLFVAMLVVLLSGCCSTPDPKFTKLAKKELEREYGLGTLSGTPDNIELIEASRKKRAVYLAEADKKKSKRKHCLFSRLFSK